MTRSVSVTYVGSTMVASFPNATPPVLWKLDLKENRSFTVALQTLEQSWVLGLTSLRGAFTPVVYFARREDAEEAFTKIQKALMKGQRSWLRKSMWILFILVVIVVLINIMPTYLFQRSASMLHKPAGQAGPALFLPSQNAPSTSLPAPMENGVPLSADDVLKPPR